MLAKNWKKILLIILVLACIINGITKLVKIVSFDNTIEALKTKVLTMQKENK